MINNNRDFSYLHRCFKENKPFVTVYNDKALNFRENSTPKFK